MVIAHLQETRDQFLGLPGPYRGHRIQRRYGAPLRRPAGRRGQPGQDHLVTFSLAFLPLDRPISDAKVLPADRSR